MSKIAYINRETALHSFLWDCVFSFSSSVYSKSGRKDSVFMHSHKANREKFTGQDMRFCHDEPSHNSGSSSSSR